ncbi:MAG: hypothetical protein JXB06_01275 [Spirochaetales bacterium]|nr:hypothetical protein [Spirochaetales bacterium]
MAGFRLFTTAEIDALGRELDIFSGRRAPAPELILKGLYPPLPICAETLIWGFHILRAAQSQKVRQLSCLIIPSCPAAQLLALALKLENRAGSYSWREKEKMLGFLAASEGRPELLQELSPLIENHPDPRIADRIASFSALPGELKRLVEEGQIDLRSAARVQSLPEDVFARLGSSPLSFSRRRQFLNELFEVGGRLKLSGRDISSLARRALEDPKPFETIHRLRFPTLSALEERFSALERELLKGSGVRLHPPPYYEGEAFTVEFEFNSPKTLARKLNALRSLEGRIDALFELLH